MAFNLEYTYKYIEKKK